MKRNSMTRRQKGFRKTLQHIDSRSLGKSDFELYHETISRTRSEDLITETLFHRIQNEEVFSKIPPHRNWRRRTGISSISSTPRRSTPQLSTYVEEGQDDDQCSVGVFSHDSRRTSLESNDTSSNDPKDKTIHADRYSDRIVLNVGGIRHETFKSTLKIFPDTRLGWIAVNGSESIDAYDPIKNEYFFDRHPTAFSQIINFYRTGKLHAPTDICGPLFEEELTYWGLEEKSMEPCCWSKYTEHRDAQDNLKVFDNLDLNRAEEDKNTMSRYDQATAEAESSNNIIQRLLKAIKPSCFRTQTWIKFKRKTWNVFEDHTSNASVLSKTVSIISLTFIILSVFSLCFHSMLDPYPVMLDPYVAQATKNNETLLCEQFNGKRIHSDLLLALDVACVTWFSIELFFRFLSSPNRMSFFLEIMNIFDVLTIFPYLIQFGNGRMCYLSRAEYIEIISITRLFRLFRFFRLSTGLEILKHTMIASSKELFLLLMLLAIPVAIFATIVYYCERKVQTTKFKTIPESLWWAIITMTTVGYGDMAPVTTLGKLVGSMCATMSVLILALPVSIIGNNFTLFYHYAQARLKLPKRPKNALVGAANALIAEPSQHSLSEEDEDEDDDIDDGDEFGPKVSLELDPELNNVAYSKRFRRERLSLYVSGPSRNAARRSRSMGNTVPSPDMKHKRKGPKRESISDDEKLGTLNQSFAPEQNSVCNIVNASTKIVSNGYYNNNKNNNNNNNNNMENLTSPKELPELPRTIVTGCDVELGHSVETAPDKLRNGLLNQIYSQTPPVHRRSGKDNEVSVRISSYDDTDSDLERKKSNNHLYVPPSAD